MSEFVALDNSPDPNIPSSSGQHVLMKDQAKIKRALRRTIITVNSRDRNFIKNPNSNNFRYSFRRPLTNVLSVELVNGSIPSYIYNINTGWNIFTFLEGTTKYKVTLVPGFYTDSTLIKELQTRLNAIPGIQNTYTVTQNANTRVIQIAGNKKAAYALLFYSGDTRDQIDLNTLAILSINTPARLLGFGLQDYYSNANGIISGVLPMDVSNFLNRIYLHLESDGHNLSRMELGAGRPDCFHVFFIEPGTDYKYLDKETIQSIFESSPAPISRMANLNVSFRDEFNRLIDLNHRESTLILEITHLE